MAEAEGAREVVGVVVFLAIVVVVASLLEADIVVATEEIVDEDSRRIRRNVCGEDGTVALVAGLESVR